jgi:hypothetical protein
VTLYVTVPEMPLREHRFLTHSDAHNFRAPVCFRSSGLIFYRHRYCTYLYYLALGKGLKIVRYQDFTKSYSKKRNQSQKRKKENAKFTNRLKKKEEDVEDELANQFNTTMNISTKRRRIGDV